MKTRAAVLFCLCVAGCSSERVETTLNGVNISVDSPTAAANVIDDTAHIEVATGKYDLAIQNDKLIVNGKNYGVVAEGDKVLISDGEITINGKSAHAIEK